MTDSDIPAFGDLLRERRVSAGLTQEALAEAAGISARAVTDLERGVIRGPRRDTLDMLADALDLAPDERQEWHQLRSRLSVRKHRHRDTGHPSTSLPQPPNQLIGREREVNALVNLITQDNTRLVTVTGAGGVGKTRVALAAGHRLADRFPSGVQFIQLASTRDPDALIPVIAHELGIQESSETAIREQLVRFLAQRELLLILDNLEHLRRSAADLAELLSTSLALKMLVTSRAALRVAAEHEFPVFPLGLPDWNSAAAIESVQRYPGIQLFLERGQQVEPDFSITDENNAAIYRICSHLDGLPLAIELAAARVKVLSPEDILSKLVDRLGFLTEGMRDAPDRHRTMRTAIAWSYDLLEPSEQLLFRQLSTFFGGWTFEAAEAVASAETSVIDGLSALANSSLIHRLEQQAGPARFGMLETVREFGLEQLRDCGEQDGAREKHGYHFLRLAEEAEPNLRGPAQPEWLNLLEADHANLRAALDWSASPEVEPEIGLRLGGALAWFWESRGHVSEGRGWLTRALARGGETSRAYMKALSGAGWLAHIQRDSAEATTLLQESLDLAREIGDQWWESWVLHLMGRVAYFEGDSQTAHAFGRESLNIAQERDDQWIIAWDEHLFGLASFIEGDFESARAHYEHSLTIREEMGYPEGISLIQGLIGILALQEGDEVSALRHFRAGLETGHEIGARWLVINWIANVVLIAARHGAPDRAARLAGFVEAMSTLSGAIPIPITEPTFQEGIRIAREKLGDAAYEQMSAAGSTMEMEEAIDEALATTLSTTTDLH